MKVVVRMACDGSCAEEKRDRLPPVLTTHVIGDDEIRMHASPVASLGDLDSVLTQPLPQPFGVQLVTGPVYWSLCSQGRRENLTRHALNTRFLVLQPAAEATNWKQQFQFLFFENETKHIEEDEDIADDEHDQCSEASSDDDGYDVEEPDAESDVEDDEEDDSSDGDDDDF